MAILSAVWAAIALVLGLFFILGADYIMGIFDSTPDFWNIMEDTYGYTRDDIAYSLFVTGAVIAASGAFAAVTAVLSMTKKFHFVALIACIISSLLGLIILVGAIGFIVAYFIYKAKDEFKSNNQKI